MGNSSSQTENDIPIEDRIPATPGNVKTVKEAAHQGLYTPLDLTRKIMEEEEHEERKQTGRRHWDTEKATKEEAQALCDDYVSTLPTDRIPQLTNEDWKLVVRQETKVIQNNDKYRFYWILYAGTPRQASVLRTRLGTCRHSEGGAALMILSLSKKKESSE